MLRPYQQIHRRKSRVIKVGNVSIGGNNQIAVQTMTNTLTSNAKDTIAQIERSAKLGVDLVRVSVPDKESSYSLKEINAKLWVIEDDKRQCEKDKDFGEKFIKLSRDVHFLNDDRAKIKLEINNHTGSSIKEIKEYTSY